MAALQPPPHAVRLAPLLQNACRGNLNNVALAAAPFDRKTRCRSVACAALWRWIFFSLSPDDDKLASADTSESCLRDMTETASRGVFGEGRASLVGEGSTSLVA